MAVVWAAVIAGFCTTLNGLGGILLGRWLDNRRSVQASPEPSIHDMWDLSPEPLLLDPDQYIDTPRQAKKRLAVILGPVFAVVTLSTGVYVMTRPCPFYASTTVAIISPSAGGRVAEQAVVQGTACRIPQDRDLWLIVVPDGVQGYFPQPGPIAVASDGTWSAQATIGAQSDTGTRFVLYVAMADRAASAALRAYFNQTPGPDHVGLTPLPDGIQVLQQIPVTR